MKERQTVTESTSAGVNDKEGMKVKECPTLLLVLFFSGSLERLFLYNTCSGTRSLVIMLSENSWQDADTIVWQDLLVQFVCRLQQLTAVSNSVHAAKLVVH